MTINTISIKSEQLQKGYFETGSGSEKVLIMGSCRVCPLVGYLDTWNKTLGNNRFTIYSTDPFNYHFDPITNEMVDLKAAINAMETHKGLLDMLASVDIHVHEWYESFGMFNTFRDKGKSIYDFGLNPTMDICSPNYNDVFLYLNDFYKFDAEFKAVADLDYSVFGKLTPLTQIGMAERGKANMEKFYGICLKSDLPEMAEHVEQNLHNTRFAWNSNHITKHFSLQVFRLMNDKYLHLDTTTEFWEEISKEDMFETPHTPITEYDVENYGFNWGEEIVNFKQYNNIP